MDASLEVAEDVCSQISGSAGNRYSSCGHVVFNGVMFNIDYQRADSMGVGGSKVSTENEGRGRKAGMPKSKGLLSSEERELSPSMEEKKSASSPGYLGVELESSGGKGEAWRSDSVAGEGTVIENSPWISTVLSWSVGCSPAEAVGSCRSGDD